MSRYLYRCVINKEESCITGYFREEYGQGSLDIVQYDLETGIFESKNVIEKINKMLPDVSWGVTLNSASGDSSADAGALANDKHCMKALSRAGGTKIY